MKLSVIIPTRQRPEWLSRALRSVFQTKNVPFDLEVVVTDNSLDDRCLEVVEKLDWQEVRYFRNQPPTGMVENWNVGIMRSTGDVILILHDDDYLLLGWEKKIKNLMQRANLNREVHAFSVQSVNESEVPLWRGGRHRSRSTTAEEAVCLLLTHSSFVRFPGMVVGRKCYEELGLFCPDFQETADLEMWLRLGAYGGIHFHKELLSAYTIHAGAMTQGMFSLETLQNIHRLGEMSAERNAIAGKDLVRARRLFFGGLFWREPGGLGRLDA
ncbi:MAG: glycosyltransferase [Blastochloris sp.]|nr:glycosyltransferase [Blastochloris sp.]